MCADGITHTEFVGTVGECNARRAQDENRYFATYAPPAAPVAPTPPAVQDDGADPDETPPEAA